MSDDAPAEVWIEAATDAFESVDAIAPDDLAIERLAYIIEAMSTMPHAERLQYAAHECMGEELTAAMFWIEDSRP